MKILRIALLALGTPCVAFADVLPAPSEAAVDENIAGLQRQAEDLILGHGTAGRIGREGILRMVALSRASARARAMTTILAADLNGDGDVTMDEAQIAADARSATGRGRLMRAVLSADADNDGHISATELRAHAEGQALRAMSPTREKRLLDLLSLDADGDGMISISEVSRANKPANKSGDNGA